MTKQTPFTEPSAPLPAAPMTPAAPTLPLPSAGPASGSHRVVRNVAVTLATQLLSWALTFAVTLSLPRYVGDAGLGKMAFAVSMAALFGTIIPLGTSTVLVREIARDRSRTGELLLAAIFLRIPLGLLMTGLLIGTISVLHAVSPNHYSSLTRTLVIIAALGMIVLALNDALASALQGQENLTRQNIAVLTEKFLSSSLLILLIFLRQPIWMLASVAVFTALASLTINLTAFRPLLPTLRWPQRETMRLLVLAGLPFFALGVFRMIYNQVDVPLLAFFTDDRTVGWYNIAIRLLGSTLFIPVALATALLPSLTRMHAESPERFLGALRRAMTLVILCAMPIAVPLIVLPRKILLGFLHYPAAFAHSAPILAIYGVGVLLWYVSQITGTGLVVLDKQREMCRISVVALVLTVAGCLVLIPLANRVWHNGGIGAALTDVSVEVYMNAAFLMALPRGTFDMKAVRVFGRSLVAVVPMAVLMLLLHGAFQWAGALAGVAIYGALCYALGCLSRDDLQMLRAAFGKRG
jgi:O-antigen/teichoic acid export membrane protein